jgi:hypothetical protein
MCTESEDDEELDEILSSHPSRAWMGTWFRAGIKSFDAGRRELLLGGPLRHGDGEKKNAAQTDLAILVAVPLG